MKQVERLEAILRHNWWLEHILDRFDDVGLPDCWLVAGALAQTVWNVCCSKDPAADIKDIDLIYFDAGDLSEAARVQAEKHVCALFAGIPAALDVQNEARIHLWYEEQFGYPIPPYTSSTDAIATFPTTATSIGVRRHSGCFDCFAPFGLEDLLNGVVRPNKRQITRAIYEAKLARWRARWPTLTYVAWDDA